MKVANAGLRARLVLFSSLMLFLELALIRWTGENLVYLSYFSNFVLLGSFLGIGIGFLGARRSRSLYQHLPLTLFGLVLFVWLFPAEIDRSGPDLLYFGEFGATGLPAWVTLPVVFLAVALVMALVGEGVARVFTLFAPLEAYRLDIAGAILGIVAFSLLSLLDSPPVVWGVVVVCLIGWLLRGELQRRDLLALGGILLVLGGQSLIPGESWSAYYRISTTQFGPTSYNISVNGIPHQVIHDVETRRRLESIYFRPYAYVSDLQGGTENVLIVGAGTGTDTAIALEQGADLVDAVEIDRRLYEIGVELHPDRPYQDARVRVHIEDGRAYLQQTEQRYDLILFALPDSLTLVSGQSSLRLESYLFTIEAFSEVKEHLRPGGVFALYNYYRERWLIDRLAGNLRAAFGHPACVESYQHEYGLALLVIGRDTSLRCASPTQPAAVSAASTTDDYPFLYLRDRGIPLYYLATLGLILAVSIISVRAASGRLGSLAPYADLFFMGAAFLLLETKSVVQFALLFGTTWLVNALVFGGILLTVFIGVEVARRKRLPAPEVLYLVLLLSLGVAWAVPQASLLALPFLPRFVAAVLIAFAPIFIANLVFAQRFQDAGSSVMAFGANLLGAMVGGLIEYLALITGYRALVVVVAGLYGLAFVTGRRHLLRLGATAPGP